MTNNLFKRVVARFTRAFIAGAFASMATLGGSMVLSAADWSSIINWIVLLVISGIAGGITGGIQAVDLYLRNKDSQK